jgi:REP element-mobilizing transposase RayT
MEPLAKPLRKQLEDAVIKARDVAEKAARAALMHLGVGEAEAPKHLREEERTLRRRLRAHGRQLGDALRPDGRQGVDHLVHEVAYEHWHRMLFARFLAENGLLMHPDGVAVSLAECGELAPDEGAADGWELAGRYASRMLPQIFRPNSPVLALAFAPEHQRTLERLLAGLLTEVFQASDSLGWVYQFWQAKRKDEVNASEVKIGADELPAVTQLFTEPYMVAFLLDNSLGAWWAARRLSQQDLREAETEDELRRKATIPGVPLEYLRFVRTPAACDCVVRASSPDESGQDGLTTHPEPVVRASSPGESGQDGLTTQTRMDEQTLVRSHGEHLPHWTCKGAVYHVVFRLADSVPQAKLDLWAAERRSIEEQAGNSAQPKAEEALRQARLRHREEVDAYLDAGHGACSLRKPEIAEIVANALKHFDGDRYRLHAWCVMPNHVHIVVEPLGDNELSNIVHSWKSFTANVINRRLGLSGAFWQADAYNHIIRTQQEYDYQVGYVWHNPDKASLRDWPWRWVASYVAGGSDSDCVVRASSPDASGSESRAWGPDPSGQDGLTTQWCPAAGTFDGWPECLADLKVMDPCCGSGHFLVAAFLLLVPMRMAAEGLGAMDAVDAVLADNLHGLELDARCVEIAVFALALAAWRFPDENGDPLGVRADMPAPQVACCGLKVAAKPQDWMALVPDDAPNAQLLRQELGLLHASFAQAPLLGSLLDPARSLKNDLATSSFDTLRDLLGRALATERPVTLWGQASELQDDSWDLALTAKGLLDAGRLLDGRYHLVVTNVPYLARGKQHDYLAAYCAKTYPSAKADLANVFLERCFELADLSRGGVTQVVMPQNWLFLSSYAEQRRELLAARRLDLVARLGTGAFEVITGSVVNILLLTACVTRPDAKHIVSAIDVSAEGSAAGKARLLKSSPVSTISQSSQLANPDARITLADSSGSRLLSEYADGVHGFGSKDSSRFFRQFAEIPRPNDPSTSAHWQQVAAERYPNGEICPSPIPTTPPSGSPDSTATPSPPPTRCKSPSPACSATAGRPRPTPRWNSPTRPAPGSPRLRQAGRHTVDDDGIVCLPSGARRAARPRPPAQAADRRLGDRRARQPEALLDKLLAESDCAGKGLDVWLRDKFFEQHAKRFHHRPFIWHVWDGLKDGFAALVNYHKLDAQEPGAPHPHLPGRLDPPAGGRRARRRRRRPLRLAAART